MSSNTCLFARVKERVDNCSDRTVVMCDFSDMLVRKSSYDQIQRALRQLVAHQKLIKIGRGIYAKTKTYPNGALMICAPLGELAREALEKLGVRTGDSRAWINYCQGTTTQVPTGRVIAVNRRVRRKISYNGYSVSYENMEAL